MKTFARCVLAAAVAGLSLSSAQAETTLRMAHFWPGASGVNEDVLQAWADTIAEECIFRPIVTAHSV